MTATHETGWSLESRIHKAYSRLPESERKLADLILDFPGNVAAYSATELSQLAGVSKAAATRLFKRLGFRTFEEARRLARDTKDWGSPLYLDAASSDKPDPKSDLQAYLEDEIRSLRATFEGIDSEALDEIVDALIAARRVWLVGYRGSQSIAAYGRLQFIQQFRHDVMLLPSAGETLAEHLGGLEPNDLLIVIGMRRRVRGLGKIMSLAVESGCPILYLTDPTAKVTTRRATWTLTCHVSSSFLFDSYTAPFSLLRFLSIEAFRKSGKRARAHIERIEHYHEGLGDFE